jgi:MFS family permease
MVCGTALARQNPSLPVLNRSDIFGRKTILLFSLAVFLASSLACALARTMIEVGGIFMIVDVKRQTSFQLIIFRALQGVGGGGAFTLI